MDGQAPQPSSPEAPVNAPPPASPGTPSATPPRSAARVGILSVVLAVLAGSAVGAVLLLRGGGVPAVLAHVPASADGFVVVNWKRVRDDPGFQTLLSLLKMRLLTGGKLARAWERARIDLSRLEGGVVALSSRGSHQEYLVAVLGDFVRSAIEDTLRTEARMRPVEVGGTRMFARQSRRRAILAGFVAPGVLAYGSEALVREAAANAGAKKTGLTTDPVIQSLLDRVDREALLHGALRLSPETRGQLRRRLRRFPVPRSLAASLGGDSGLAIRVAAAFESAAEAIRAREAIESFLGRGLEKLSRLRFLPPRMLRMAQSLARGVRLATSGNILELSASLRMKGGSASMLGVLSAVAIPSFVKYMRRSKSIEAQMNLRRIFEGARAYYETERVDRSGTMLPRAFPASAGPTPAGSPCAHPGKRYPPDAKAWEHSTWRALLFNPVDPLYYRYTFSSKGTGKDATFVIRAEGDLDCDGVWSTFERKGSIDAQGRVRGSRPRIRRGLE